MGEDWGCSAPDPQSCAPELRRRSLPLCFMTAICKAICEIWMPVSCWTEVFLTHLPLTWCLGRFLHPFRNMGRGTSSPVLMQLSWGEWAAQMQSENGLQPWPNPTHFSGSGETSYLLFSCYFNNCLKSICTFHTRLKSQNTATSPCLEAVPKEQQSGWDCP